MTVMTQPRTRNPGSHPPTPIATPKSAAPLHTSTRISSANEISSSPTLDLYGERWAEVSTVIVPEALSTLTCILLACLVRCIITLLFDFAAYHDTKVSYKECRDIDQGGILGCYTREIVALVSLFLGCLMTFAPKKILTAPGWIFSSNWMLHPIRNRFGSIPNSSLRISEMVLGRISSTELALILPTHIIASVIGVLTLHLLLPASLARRAIEPLVYSESSSWILNCFWEIVVNAIWTVCMWVVPEICRLNDVPKWVGGVIMLPVYTWAVDGEGMPSAFSPPVFYALNLVSRQEEMTLRQSSHLIGPLIGGWLGGNVMLFCFPDEIHF